MDQQDAAPAFAASGALLRIIPIALNGPSGAKKLQVGATPRAVGTMAGGVFLIASRLCVIALCMWLVLGTLKIYPYYLAYFNEFTGGPANGYRYLLDSNLDWGQDLKNLGRYLQRNGIEKVKLSYFGPDFLAAHPNVYGINHEPLRPGEPASGIIAISVTNLQEVYQSPHCAGGFEWLREREPIAKIGYSIFVYRISRDEKLLPPVKLPPGCGQT